MSNQRSEILDDRKDHQTPFHYHALESKPKEISAKSESNASQTGASLSTIDVFASQSQSTPVKSSSKSEDESDADVDRALKKSPATGSMTLLRTVGRPVGDDVPPEESSQDGDFDSLENFVELPVHSEQPTYAGAGADEPPNSPDRSSSSASGNVLNGSINQKVMRDSTPNSGGQAPDPSAGQGGNGNQGEPQNTGAGGAGSLTNLTVKNTTRSVSAPNLSQLWDVMTNSGARESASVTPKFEPQPQYEYDDSDNVKKVVVTVVETKEMPVWTEGSTQCPPIKNEWDRLLGLLDTHENNHLAIDKKHFSTVHLKLVGKKRDVAFKALDDEITAADTENDAYDSSTNHGASEGAKLNTAVQCAPEKVQSSGTSAFQDGSNSNPTQSGISGIGSSNTSSTPQTAQAKLNISQPGDPQELEADQVAEHIVQMSDSVIQRTCSGPGKCECDDCRAKNDASIARRSVSKKAETDSNEFLSKSGGSGRQVLNNDISNFEEPNFGHDFSKVRIHADDQVYKSTGGIVLARASATENGLDSGQGHFQDRSIDLRPSLARGLINTRRQNLVNTSTVPSQIQRDTPPGTGPATIDGEPVANQQELAAWYDSRLKRLAAQADELQRNSQLVPPSLTEATASGIKGRSDALAAGKAELDIPSSLAAQSWADYKYINGMNGSEAIKAFGAAEKLKDAGAKAQATANALETTVIPDLRERQRAAFRNNDESALAKWADIIFNVLDSSLDLKGGATALIKSSSELTSIGAIAIKDSSLYPPVSSKVPQILEIADLVNKAYSAFQLAQTAVDLMSSHPTGNADAKAGIKAMATIIDAGTNLLGVTAGLNFYINWYIGPMTDIALKMLSVLEDIGHDVNKDLIINGTYDKVNWNLEPGGRAVFDFMLLVMHVASAEAIPSPVPENVSKYLIKNEDEINAGQGNKSEMPTEGHLFWRKTEQGKIATWVFNQRADLWGIFYGDIPVPK